MGDQMMKAQLRIGKTPDLKEMITQGYKTQGLEGMDNSCLRGSGPKKRIAQG